MRPSVTEATTRVFRCIGNDEGFSSRGDDKGFSSISNDNGFSIIDNKSFGGVEE